MKLSLPRFAVSVRVQVLITASDSKSSAQILHPREATQGREFTGGIVVADAMIERLVMRSHVVVSNPSLSSQIDDMTAAVVCASLSKTPSFSRWKGTLRRI